MFAFPPLPHRATGLILALIPFVPVAAAQAPSRRIAAQITPGEPRVSMAGSTTSRPADSVSMGHLTATQLHGMSLILKRSSEQEAALDQLLRDQQDPASPLFHQWLTPKSFGDRFGFAQSDLDVITTWLRTQGLEIDEISQSNNRIVFSGATTAAEAAFGISLQRFSYSGQTFFANSDPVRLPASLAAVVSGVTGLSSYHMQSGPKTRPLSRPTPLYTTSSGDHYIVPWDFRQIFDINLLINAGVDGTGIKIGVIGQSAVDTAQLTYFQQKTGVAAKLPTMVLVPNTGVSNRVAGDESESELDTEYAGGSAPGAGIQFIYTGCGTTSSTSALPATTDCQNDGVNTSLIYAITNNLAPILTFSYGACEASIAAYAFSTLEPVLKQANAQGQTILASSGDSGAATCDQGTGAKAATKGLTVSYPASSAYVTAVGGTQLSDAGAWSSTINSYGGSAAGYIGEQSWNDTASYGSLSASGGGASKVFSKPLWQAGQGVPQDGFRDVPDVAFPASIVHSPYLACTGDATCLNNATFGGTTANGGLYGGTSLSAPNFAAMLAVIEQKNASGPLGNLNPMLYAIAQGSASGTVFHDVSSGDNIVPCVLTTPDCFESKFMKLGYATTAGYDQVTGLGSISATGLAAALSSKTLPVSIAASSSAPVVGQPITFTATVLGGNPSPTGTVTFSINGTNISPAIALTGGSASYVYSGFTQPAYSLTTAYPSVKATYSGNATYSVSSSAITVAAVQVPVMMTITSSGTSPVQANSPSTFTFTATGQYGTPTGYVLLTVDGLYVNNALAPLPLVNGIATYTTSGFSTAGIHSVLVSYFSEADRYNFISSPAGFQRPYTAYEGGQAEADVLVSSSSQTLTPVVTVTAPAAAIAPGGTANVAFLVTGNGSTALSGGYFYSLDGGAPVLSRNGTGTGTSLAFTFGFTSNTGWTPGSHTVQFTYAGDANYKPSSPAQVTFNVVIPSFALAVTPTTITAVSGGSASTTLSVTANPTYSGSTTFKLGVLSYTGAAFSGCYKLSSLSTLTQPGTSASLTLTMYAGTANCSSANKVSLPLAMAVPPLRTGAGVLCASFGIAGCLLIRRRRLAAQLFAALLFTSLFFTVGCSGSGGSSTTGSTGSSGGGTTTPTVTGTYVLQVLGTSGTDNTLTATTTFTLIVQ